MSKRVLIVDDEEPMRRILRRWVEEEGHAVREAASAEAAVEVLGDQQVDIAFTDVQMDGRDGVWLAREIRTRHPRTAVVLATAVATLPPAVTMQPGVVAYIVKPFERHHVRHALAMAEEWRLASERSRAKDVAFDELLSALD